MFHWEELLHCMWWLPSMTDPGTLLLSSSKTWEIQWVNITLPTLLRPASHRGFLGNPTRSSLPEQMMLGKMGWKATLKTSFCLRSFDAPQSMGRRQALAVAFRPRASVCSICRPATEIKPFCTRFPCYSQVRRENWTFSFTPVFSQADIFSKQISLALQSCLPLSSAFSNLGMARGSVQLQNSETARLPTYLWGYLPILLLCLFVCLFVCLFACLILFVCFIRCEIIPTFLLLSLPSKVGNKPTFEQMLKYNSSVCWNSWDLGSLTICINKTHLESQT